MDGSAWRIWVAIVLLLDAAIGLLGMNRLAKVIAPRRLTFIALAEAAVAVVLVAWHFVRG
jgi:hypothetical protein